MPSGSVPLRAMRNWWTSFGRAREFVSLRFFRIALAIAIRVRRRRLLISRALLFTRDARSKNLDHGLNDAGQNPAPERGDRRRHDRLVRGEQLPGACEARDPERATVSPIATALASSYDLLVTWHRILSPRPAWASTMAGRSFARERSENGNRTSTTAPTAGAPTPRLPPADSSLPQAQLH